MQSKNYFSKIDDYRRLLSIIRSSGLSNFDFYQRNCSKYMFCVTYVYDKKFSAPPFLL